MEAFPIDVVVAVKALWADSGIQECYSKSNEFFIQDTAD